MLTPYTEIEQNCPRAGDPHALVEHFQLMAWLLYLTNFASDIHCPRPEGLDITLAALNTSRETIQEAERVGRVGNLF
jgi:hypothetical protein